MRILTRNILQKYTTLTMTNEDVNYSKDNFLNNMLEEYSKASSTSSTITLSFDKDVTVNSIFFGYHNASSIVFTFKDSIGSVLLTESFSTPDIYAKKYIEKITTIREIVIDLISTNNVFIGNISCGEYTQLYNVALPITVEHKDTSVFSLTEGGQSLYRTGITLQSFNIDCVKITDDQVNSFETAYSYVHKGRTFWMDRNEDLDGQLFGIFDSNYRTTRVNTLTNLSLSFTEAK